ncbi:MAG: transposase [Clostridia bacterium]
MGVHPYKVKYNPATESYRVSFHKHDCENCPLREKCKAKIQKKSAIVIVSAKSVQRANYMKTLSTPKYKELSRKRNGVEALPSLLRRKYGIDNMPVRGFVRSKR